MWGIVLVSITIVMLGIVYFNEGWKSALKYVGYFILVGFVLGGVVAGLNVGYENRGAISFLFWGGFTLFLFFHNLNEGHIGHL